MSPQSKMHVQESPARRGVSDSEVHENPVSKGFKNTSNLKTVLFAQQSSNSPSAIPSYERYKEEELSKTPKMINLVSTGLKRSGILDIKPQKKYSLFAKYSFTVVAAREVANKTHTFLTRENQNIQEFKRHFDGTLKHFCPMLFASNQEQNQSYTFKGTLLQL